MALRADYVYITGYTAATMALSSYLSKYFSSPTKVPADMILEPEQMYRTVASTLPSHPTLEWVGGQPVIGHETLLNQGYLFQQLFLVLMSIWEFFVNGFPIVQNHPILAILLVSFVGLVVLCSGVLLLMQGYRLVRTRLVHTKAELLDDVVKLLDFQAHEKRLQDLIEATVVAITKPIMDSLAEQQRVVQNLLQGYRNTVEQQIQETVNTTRLQFRECLQEVVAALRPSITRLRDDIEFDQQQILMEFRKARDYVAELKLNPVTEALEKFHKIDLAVQRHDTDVDFLKLCVHGATPDSDSISKTVDMVDKITINHQRRISDNEECLRDHAMHLRRLGREMTYQQETTAPLPARVNDIEESLRVAEARIAQLERRPAPQYHHIAAVPAERNPNAIFNFSDLGATQSSVQGYGLQFGAPSTGGLPSAAVAGVTAPEAPAQSSAAERAPSPMDTDEDGPTPSGTAINAPGPFTVPYSGSPTPPGTATTPGHQDGLPDYEDFVAPSAADYKGKGKAPIDTQAPMAPPFAGPEYHQGYDAPTGSSTPRPADNAAQRQVENFWADFNKAGESSTMGAMGGLDFAFFNQQAAPGPMGNGPTPAAAASAAGTASSTTQMPLPTGAGAFFAPDMFPTNQAHSAGSNEAGTAGMGASQWASEPSPSSAQFNGWGTRSPRGGRPQRRPTGPRGRNVRRGNRGY